MNPQPTDYKSVALPIELFRRNFVKPRSSLVLFQLKVQASLITYPQIVNLVPC